MIQYLRFPNDILSELQRKLVGKYSKVFEINDSVVTLQSGWRDVLVLERRSQERHVEQSPSISASITITKADYASVQNFFWAICEKTMNAKFPFDQPGSQGVSKATIGVSELESHLNIVNQAFMAIEKDADKKAKPLMQYLLVWLPDHLNALLESSVTNELTLAEKSHVGSKLYNILQQEGVLEQHLGDMDLSFFALNWMSFSPGTSAFWRWLEDKDAVSHLGIRDKAWLSKIQTRPDRNSSLLFKLSLTVGKHWLQASDWDAFWGFKWIDVYLDMVRRFDVDLY